MRTSLILVSKALSYVLRHNPQGLNMDKEGWVRVVDLLVKMNISVDDLEEIVRTNDKKRFAYNEDHTMIRASQGHSIDVEIKYKKSTPPIFLYHGTSEDYLDSIMKTGLSKMKRTHVHLSQTKDTAIAVGKRHSKDKEPIILEIEAREMAEDGYAFYISENGVWLTDGVPREYINVL